jgi:hypothetical protein
VAGGDLALILVVRRFQFTRILTATIGEPSPTFSAVSTASASRAQVRVLALEAIDNDFDVVAAGFDRGGYPPSTSEARRRARTRMKPCLSSSTNWSRCSPFCPRMIGAKTEKREPDGNCCMWAIIRSPDWAEIFWPHPWTVAVA